MNPTRPDDNPRWVGGRGTNYVRFRKAGDIRDPSQRFVILDERSDTINDGYFAIDLSDAGTPEGLGPANPSFMIDFPVSYHRGAATISFVDGHVEKHPWLEATTKPPLGEAHPRMHTAPTDRDVRWLHEHATYPK